MRRSRSSTWGTDVAERVRVGSGSGSSSGWRAERARHRAERERRRAASSAVLQIRDLHVHYDQSHALQGVDLTLDDGVHAVVGRNGMGKTTLCNAVMGLLPVRRGSIRFEGGDVTGLAPYQVAARGIAYTPQGRRLWPSLTVDEHLRLAGGKGGGSWTAERVYDVFPPPRRTAPERGRAALGRRAADARHRARPSSRTPRLLVLDEPTEGLAPLIVAQLEALLSALAEEGDVAILLIEQNIGVATAIAEDRRDHGQRPDQPGHSRGRPRPRPHPAAAPPRGGAGVLRGPRSDGDRPPARGRAAPMGRMGQMEPAGPFPPIRPGSRAARGPSRRRGVPARGGRARTRGRRPGRRRPGGGRPSRRRLRARASPTRRRPAGRARPGERAPARPRHPIQRADSGPAAAARSPGPERTGAGTAAVSPPGPARRPPLRLAGAALPGAGLPPPQPRRRRRGARGRDLRHQGRGAPLRARLPRVRRARPPHRRPLDLGAALLRRRPSAPRRRPPSARRERRLHRRPRRLGPGHGRSLRALDRAPQRRGRRHHLRRGLRGGPPSRPRPCGASPWGRPR